MLSQARKLFYLVRNIVAMGFLAASGSCMAQAMVGQQAPAFTLITAEGKTVSLESLRGKTVVLEWTNHDCPFVRKHYDSGNMQAQQKEAADAGAVWLQVISSAPGKQGFVDGPSALALNKARQAMPSATLLDPAGTVGKQYGARTTPHMYVVNPQGVLVYQGGIDSIASAKTEDVAKAQQFVRMALTELRAGKSVTVPLARPYGCSVKYADS